MKITILMGSFRPDGNTATFTNTIIKELKKKDLEVNYITLADKNIEPCTACWTCQDIFDTPGCPKDDDVQHIFDSVIESDCIIFATPIYSWYCTPPMKSVMDRLVYTMNKFYGSEPGPCLWEGKKLGIISTCGYDIDQGAGVYEEGIKRYAAHSKLNYIGMTAMRDNSDRTYYQKEEALELAEDFITRILV